MHDEIEEKLKQLLIEDYNLEVQSLSNSIRFTEDLGFDSLDAIEMVQAVNAKFGTNIANDKITDIKTINDLILLIKQYSN